MYENVKILIVDDELAILNFLQNVLSDLYKNIDCADSFLSAKSLILKNEYDLIISDLVLGPNGSGSDLYEIAKKKGCEFILMSGFLPTININEFKYALNKPFSIEELLNLVEKALKGKN